MSTNLFTRMTRVFAPIFVRPQRVGTIASVDGTVVVVTELGGGTARVVGSGTVGQQVYFRGNEIVGPAPSLPEELIEE